ncbi:hypothetical protein [Streptomyces sp. 147326]|uniref:hypothetical protein n=1 Tax=Streptomyces sp. 147326 TaxID=3074379 RepID=UPI0038576041
MAGRGGDLAGGGLALGLLPVVQFYLQEGRPYALVAAGAGLSTLLLVPLLESGPGRRAWHMPIGPGIFLAIGGLGARADRPDRKGLSAAAVGLPLLAVPQLGLIGLSLVQPLFPDRYVLFSMLGLALLIGAALGAAVRACAPRFPAAAGLLVPGVVGVVEDRQVRGRRVTVDERPG